MSNVVWGFPNPQAILVDEAGQGGGGVIYKSYTARLTQSGTSAPVATVLEDSTGLGNTWARVAAGAYTCTFSSPIADDNKIWWPVIGEYLGKANGYIPLIDGNGVVGFYTMYFNGPIGARTAIQLEFMNASFLPEEWSSLLDFGGGANSVINFEYRLYP